MATKKQSKMRKPKPKSATKMIKTKELRLVRARHFFCPNCGAEKKDLNNPSPGCVLESLLDIVIDRGNIRDSNILRVLHYIDIHVLWHKLDPIIAQLEEAIRTNPYA